MRLHYAQRVNGPALHDALLAAGIVVIPPGVETTPPDVLPPGAWVNVADGTSETAVAAVVAAHDPDAPGVAEQLEAENAGVWADLADRYQTILTEIDQGEAALAQAAWDGMTAAQRADRLRQVALGLLAHDRAEMRALRALVRRLLGDG